ncbi:hypothetical protein [Petrocella atlantisensis]|nr:hypothetical protein [Petrocella atlantisensis]
MTTDENKETKEIMMTLLHLLISFGGGVFAATIGALGAFIFVGFTGLVGIGTILAGGEATILNDIAFGSYLGPHIAFAGGVAAVAFAANKKKLMGDANGTDIVAPMFGLGDPTVLLVGGIFGSLGYAINYLLSSVLAVQTDTIALTVVISGLIVRLVFGKTGLIGTFDGSKGDVRRYFPEGKFFLFMLILAAGLGLVVSNMAIALNIAAIGFTISAASLIFAEMGLPVPGTHHITMVAGLAAVSSGDPYIGMAFGILSMIVGEVFTLVFNSHNDTHIDPPAGAIFICSFIVLAIF